MSKTRYLANENQAPPMADSIAMSLLMIFGVPMFVLGWIGDLDPIKSWISYIGGGVMITIRFVFLVDRWYHSMWMRKMERRRIKREMSN